ncbi:MAG: helix-turn-helix domain-containing protein [Limnoraphis sp.]
MPVATTVKISTLIRTLRQRLGLSQRQFGEQLGVVFQTVNNWENRRTHPTRMALMVIRRQLEEMGDDGKDLLKQCPVSQESSVICDSCVKPVFLR